MSSKFTLSGNARNYLRTFKKAGGHSLREFNRSTILLFLDKGLTISEIENYTTYHQAELIALACGPVPEGRRRWTIRLLVEELNKQNGFETITYGSVRKLLKKTNLSLG